MPIAMRILPPGSFANKILVTSGMTVSALIQGWGALATPTNFPSGNRTLRLPTAIGMSLVIRAEP